MTRTFHDGADDGLEALEALDPARIHSFSDLLTAMKKTAFGGRRLGEAFEVLKAMIEDPDCFVVMTLSGAMTIAKMGKIICTMLDRGMVQAIVSTGALMAHGMSEAVGQTHYKYQPVMDDVELFEKGYNRVYDTLEMELNLNHVEEVAAVTLNRLRATPAASRRTALVGTPEPGTGADAGRAISRPGYPQKCLPARGPGVHPRVHGFRTGPRYVHLVHESSRAGSIECGTRSRG